MEGIHQFGLGNSELDSFSGLPTWHTSNNLVPHTRGADPNLPMAIAHSYSLTYAGNELRIFFWDQDERKIRQAWWANGAWNGLLKDKYWDVPKGPGRAMDSICWFDVYEGVGWSCFYSDATGKLFELSCGPVSGPWTSAEVADIGAESYIQAFAKWEQGIHII